MSDEKIDGALKRLARYRPEFGDGFSVHTPMTIRAMTHIGADEGLIDKFVEKAIARFKPWPTLTKPVTEENWHTALGDPSRVTDWREFFAAKIAREGWRNSGADIIPKLLPGVMGASRNCFRHENERNYARQGWRCKIAGGLAALSRGQILQRQRRMA